MQIKYFEERWIQDNVPKRMNELMSAPQEPAMLLDSL